MYSNKRKVVQFQVVQILDAKTDVLLLVCHGQSKNRFTRVREKQLVSVAFVKYRI